MEIAKPVQRCSSDHQEDAASILSTSSESPELRSQDEDIRSIASESVHSVTSTFKYGHESFEPFRIKVAQLCQEIWPLAGTTSRRKRSRCRALIRRLFRRTPSTIFTIHRGPGGSFNRIVDIEVKESAKGTPTSYVLRIPRFENARPDRDLAILEYVCQYYPSVPVAEVVKSDLTCNNVIGKPYLLQEKLSGFQVHSDAAEYLHLTHQQKLDFASQFGTILRTLFERKSKEPGLIELTSPSNTAEPSHGENACKFCIRPFEVGRPSPMGTEGHLDATPASGYQPDYTSPLNFLQGQLGRWQADAEMRGDELEAECMDKSSRLAAQLEKAGFLGKEGNAYVPSHRDLNNGPQNILIDVDQNGKLSITGILDWDSAIFAPAVVACQPPMWIWAWDSNGEEDEKLANETPPTMEAWQLKKAFEDAVGPGWLRLSYGHGFRLARKLCEFAFEGVHSSWKLEEMQELFREWAAMRPEGMEKIDGPMDDEDSPSDNDDSNGLSSI
ncbi:MAG: hypothetical protein OHK93_002663 [Ramalina farinacea]|uniref:Aminoglycoside phosphotransferase domain-containing protein n=1 Tax=Ramalina farinacea TaxID=258253 RepID=A0AA43QTL3_9LECA|nr:hypothetical protein [Ramalina farinacea]